MPSPSVGPGAGAGGGPPPRRPGPDHARQGPQRHRGLLWGETFLTLALVVPGARSTPTTLVVMLYRQAGAGAGRELARGLPRFCIAFLVLRDAHGAQE